MDVNIINPFINETLNILETMAFVKSEAGKPYPKKDSVAQGDVSGIVALPARPMVLLPLHLMSYAF